MIISAWQQWQNFNFETCSSKLKKKKEETEEATVGLAKAKEKSVEFAITAEPDNILASK